MGEIRIAAMAVKNVRDDNDGGAVNQNVSDIGTIPEKALKGRALSHSTRHDLIFLCVDLTNNSLVCAQQYLHNHPIT
jgi:hypothetical protein